MTPAQELLKVLIRASEGTRKAGFSVGSVTFTLDQVNDRISATVTIPVGIAANATTGALEVTAKDFLELPA